MSLNVLIIGYGSIGKRHTQVLQEYFSNANITFISTQNLPNAYPSLQALPNPDDFDYYIIASPTAKHLEHLQTLDSKLLGKKIFVEKPLFESAHHFTPSGKNNIFVGFCLRFHPLLVRVKELIQTSHPYFVEISCGSYLPLWREGVDYRNIYSAHKSQGGGVLLDLSHELDYVSWLFGNLKNESIVGFNGRLSELEISSDDTLCLIAQSTQNTLLNLSLNYFSKIPKRLMRVHSADFSLEADLIQNTLTITTKSNEKTQEIVSFERNELFAIMHQSLLCSESFLHQKIPQSLLKIIQDSQSAVSQDSQIPQKNIKAILPDITQSLALMNTLTRLKHMKLNQKLLCIIGCRGGSKGVKNKNITPIAGKPLLAHTILQALQSKLFEHIVLSTDSEEIARVGQEWGAEVFFLRDKEMATDSAGKLPAIRDALLKSEEYYKTRFDVVFDLDATSPLRLVSDITQAYQQFVQDDNDILITAAPARKSPYFNLIEIFEDENTPKVDLSKRPQKPILRRQDSPKCYDMNASIYIWKREALLENDSVFIPNTGLFVMPEERSIDIDTPLDFEFVEFMLLKEKQKAFNGGGG